MFRLPHSLPHPLRSELERALSSTDPAAVLAGIAPPFLRCFQAAGVVCSVQVNGAPAIPLAVAGESFDCAALSQAWLTEKIHSAITQELRTKHHPLSYSRFSWPFPHSTAPFVVPTEYTLIVPFSSESVVRLTSTPLFSGYLALLLHTFPTFDDEVVQLIITLPSLLSELFLCSLTATSVEERSLLHLAKEVRQHSLAALRLTSVIEGNREVIASLAQLLNRLELSAEECLLPTPLLPACTTPLSVNQIVSDTVSLLQPLFDSAAIPVRCELDGETPLCKIDPGLFPAVVHRLLDDSLKKCVPGHPLTIRTRCEEGGTVLVELFFHAVHAEERDLSLVQHLVEAHEGRLFTYRGADTTAAIVLELPRCRE